MIRIGNKVVAGSADVDLSTVLKSLNKTGLSIWIGTQTEHDALAESVKNNEKTTFITYDTDEDVFLIIDTVISYGKTWSSVKISSELAKKINASDVYTKEQVDEIINAKLASALKYRGAVNTTALLPGSAENGDTYFVKADGFMYAYNSTTSVWDALGTVADMTNYFTKTEITAMLQDKADKFQYNVLPTASSETVGMIVQYTGADIDNYKNGYFYKGVDNGDSTYSWIIDPAYYTSDVIDALHTAKYYNATIAPDCNTLTETYVLVNAGNSYVENHYPAQDLFFVKTIYSEDTVDGFQTAVAYGAISSDQKGIMYSRVKTSGTWSDWKQLATTDSTLKTIQLSGSVDCNTLTEPGLYTARAGAVTALTNAPTDAQVQLDGGFSILATDTSTSNVYYGMQMFIPYGPDVPFIRKAYYLNGQHWTDWQQLATMANLPKLVNKTYTTDEAGNIALMYQPGTVMNVYVNRNDGKEYDIKQWIYNNSIYVRVSAGGEKITGEIPLSIFTIGV